MCPLLIPKEWSSNELEAQLERLPSLRRAAVAAACVGRVLPLFEVISEEGTEHLRSAVAVAWRYASDETLAPFEVRHATYAVQDTEQARQVELEEEGGGGGALARVSSTVLEAVHSLLEMLDSDARRPSEKSAAHSITKAYDAVVYFARHEDGFGVTVDEWPAEEQEFQQRILGLAEGSEGVEVIRAVAADDTHSPGWRKRLRDEWGYERDAE